MTAETPKQKRRLRKFLEAIIVIGAIVGFLACMVWGAVVIVNPWIEGVRANRKAEEEILIELKLDIYNPENSSLWGAYNNCVEELRRQNFTLYEAQFEMRVWMRAETFTEFLDLLRQYNKTMVFHDSPKNRGFLGIGNTQAFIWFKDELPDESVITIYYFLEN